MEANKPARPAPRKVMDKKMMKRVKAGRGSTTTGDITITKVNDKSSPTIGHS